MGAYAPSRHFCPEMWLPIFFFDLFRKVSTEARCWGSPPPNGNGKARRCVEGSWRDDRRSSSGHWRGEKSCLATPSGSGIFARSPEGDITRDGCDPEGGEHHRGRVFGVAKLNTLTLENDQKNKSIRQIF